MISTVRLVCLVALFAVLCAKGGELCSLSGARFLPGLFGDDEKRDLGTPEPLRTREETFRGVSPLPDVSERMFSSLRLDRR